MWMIVIGETKCTTLWEGTLGNVLQEKKNNKKLLSYFAQLRHYQENTVKDWCPNWVKYTALLTEYKSMKYSHW